MGNPSSLGDCGNDLELLNIRCQSLMNEITPNRVRYHAGWGHCMCWRPAASQEVALWAEECKEGWQLSLILYPGNSMTQARILYKNLDIEAILELTKTDWNVKPHFHLAHIQRNLKASTNVTMPLAEYLAFWVRTQQGSLKQVDIVDPAFFARVLGEWLRLGLLDPEDEKRILDQVSRGNMKKVNICPGLKITYRWGAEAAAELDSRGILPHEVRAKILEAFSTWEQSF